MKGILTFSEKPKLKKFYSDIDEDKFGKKFIILLEPFIDCDGGFFFELKKEENGDYSVIGECYIYYSQPDTAKRAKKHIKDIFRELKNKRLYFKKCN